MAYGHRNCVDLYARLALLIFVAIPLCSAVDELLSARCQAKCLVDFEDLVLMGNDTLMKRQLKHAIISLCKDDRNCSSCSSPCQEVFEDADSCMRSVCHATVSEDHCRSSCDFLGEIHTDKPGACPAPKRNAKTLECVVSCRIDADCQHTEKCCPNGCGRSCSPVIDTPRGLLPTPEKVSISERKRGRSAIVRWVMKRLLPRHTDTHTNLYVVQWRWSVRRDQPSHWQTVTVKNKPYAILKHLLSPGLYYKFRVAAVDANGSKGYSKESDYFKLSKSPKAPGKPRNLESAGAAERSAATGALEQRVRWMAPTSDLPIVHYQVTWSVAPKTTADDPAAAANKTERSSSSLLNDMPKAAARKKSRRGGASNREAFDGYWTELVSSERNSARLTGLDADTDYIVEVHAIVETENAELPGGKATLLLKTPASPLIPPVPLPLSANGSQSPQPTASRVDDVTISVSTVPSVSGAREPVRAYANTTIGDSAFGKGGSNNLIANARVEKPYFSNGLLKTDFVWDLNRAYVDPSADYLFDLSWRMIYCSGKSTSNGIMSSKPFKALSRVTRYELYDLHFGCQYAASVTVFVVSADGRAAQGSASVNFETPLCRDTVVRGRVTPDCPPAAQGGDTRASPSSKFSSRSTNLACTVVFGASSLSSSSTEEEDGIAYSSTNDQNITASCSWDAPISVVGGGDTTVRGYRVVSGVRVGGTMTSSLDVDLSTANIRIMRASKRSVQLTGLRRNTEYVIQVQAISSLGEGPAVSHAFIVPPDADQGILYRTEDKPSFIHEIDKNWKPPLDEITSSERPRLHSNQYTPTSSSCSIYNRFEFQFSTLVSFSIIYLYV